MYKITKDFLRQNPDCIFVFGDNLLRKGKGGAAILRDEPNTYGFITKKAPNNKKESFYTIEEYFFVFNVEFKKLITKIETENNKVFFISKLGSGLANRYNIFQNIIEPNLQKLNKYPNVKFLY